MFGNLVRKIVGTRNDRILKQAQKVVQQTNQFSETFEALSDDELKAKTEEFKARIGDGATLDALLPEAFAVVREASFRTLGLRHYDVQLIGGWVLHSGRIAEMRTGEGKTLMATLPSYLNALNGQGVHIVTVNDYLAKRDAEWMRPVYEFLGMSVGINLSGMGREEKQAQYAADITYGTNNEFGFDYLRDNMAFSIEDVMQRKEPGAVNLPSFAIVDEVDSILIDEARTPLVISGADQESSKYYNEINQLIPSLKAPSDEYEGDYSLDEKNKQAFLTEIGHDKIEQLLFDKKVLQDGESLYDSQNIPLMHHVYAALKAHLLFKKDVDYIVANNEVVIVDEHTGRTMPGRRWSDGLHQAVEAKEHVKIQNENQTLASITYQNYFRLYHKLSGMTGTADTEAYEFQQIYGLECVVIPTNRPMQRKDFSDLVFMTQLEKFDAIVTDIEDCNKRKQPVLVGTISIETSEFLSKHLRKKKIPHKVLNAKYHEQEAGIIADAGLPGAVTIATNMAGRGTDIVLGGKFSSVDKDGEEFAPEEYERRKASWSACQKEVLDAGGLRIIGTERHESRRIDNQLRGRSGRQGDPGSSQFYLSVEDNLMRIFIPTTVSGMLARMGMEKGEAITHPWVTKAIENAQRKVEGHNFDIRKQLLEYDNVANDQRKVIYQQRAEIMAQKDISRTIDDLRNDVIHVLCKQYVPENSLVEEWDLSSLKDTLKVDFDFEPPIDTWCEECDPFDEEIFFQKLSDEFNDLMLAKKEKVGEDAMLHLEKTIMLNVLDTQWKDHLSTMDYLRQSIHLRGYAQKDPKQEYKREAFQLFQAMLENIKREVISLLARVKVDIEFPIPEFNSHLNEEALKFEHDNPDSIESGAKNTQNKKAALSSDEVPKVGRNEKCPCGSGLKYKHCHGKIAAFYKDPEPSLQN